MVQSCQIKMYLIPFYCRKSPSENAKSMEASQRQSFDTLHSLLIDCSKFKIHACCICTRRSIQLLLPPYSRRAHKFIHNEEKKKLKCLFNEVKTLWERPACKMTRRWMLRCDAMLLWWDPIGSVNGSDYVYSARVIHFMRLPARNFRFSFLILVFSL